MSCASPHRPAPAQGLRPPAPDENAPSGSSSARASLPLGVHDKYPIISASEVKYFTHNGELIKLGEGAFSQVCALSAALHPRAPLHPFRINRKSTYVPCSASCSGWARRPGSVFLQISLSRVFCSTAPTFSSTPLHRRCRYLYGIGQPLLTLPFRFEVRLYVCIASLPVASLAYGDSESLIAPVTACISACKVLLCCKAHLLAVLAAHT